MDSDELKWCHEMVLGRLCENVLICAKQVWKLHDETLVPNRLNSTAIYYMSHSKPTTMTYESCRKLIISANSTTMLYARSFVELKTQSLDKLTTTEPLELVMLNGLRRGDAPECAICQDSPIKGTTCPCGHTETAVFVPCGHMYCVHPCFCEFMKHSGVPVITPYYDSNDAFGEIFKHLDRQKLQASHVLCPMCRQTISDVYKLEDIRVSDAWIEELRPLVSTIMRGLVDHVQAI